MTLISFYDPGDVVSVLFTVTDGAGSPYDPPGGVKFHYTSPDGTDYTKVYLTDTTVVSKVSTGVYKLLISIPYALSAVGQWYYDAMALDGSSNSLQVTDGVFIVRRLATLA